LCDLTVLLLLIRVCRIAIRKATKLGLINQGEKLKSWIVYTRLR